MKRFKYLICSSISLMLFTSCLRDEMNSLINDAISTNEEIKEITATINDFGTTRSELYRDDNDINFKWSAGDTLGVFPDTGDQVCFTIDDSQAGSATAKFDGGGWALKSTHTYRVYFPYIRDIDLKKDAIPLDYFGPLDWSGQIQIGNNNYDHLGKYDYLASDAVSPSDGKLNIIMNHVGAIMILRLKIPEPGIFTYLTIYDLDHEKMFPIQATLDLSGEKSVLKDVKYWITTSMWLYKIETKEENEEIVVSMMIPPIDFTGKQIKVELNRSDNMVASGIISNPKNLEAGKPYEMTATLSDLEEGHGYPGSPIDAKVRNAVNKSYTTLKRVFPWDCLTLSESAGSVQLYPTRRGGDWWDSGVYMQMFMHTFKADNGILSRAWNAATESIDFCNSNISMIEESGVYYRKNCEAEIRGIRAYWYYYLVDKWGNVPLVLDSNKDKSPTNSSREEVYNWLVSEINEIIPDLPEAEGNYGKFTKASAHALLAKLYLNSEAWGFGNKYAQAANEAQKVITDPGLELLSNWKDNFSSNNAGNKESILSAQYNSAERNNANILHFLTLGYVENMAIGASFGAWNGFCAQPDYVKLFMHGTEEERNQMTRDPEYNYYDDPDNDPRISSFRLGQQYDKRTGEMLMTGHSMPMNHYAEVFPIHGTEYEGTLWREVQQHDGGRAGKWEYAAYITSAMNNDFAIFRLADFYLVRAEALFRSGGSVAEATSLVNAVRQRAWGDASHNYSKVTLDDIQLERRLEMAWEGVSREDDIRFGCYDKDMWSMFRADTSSAFDEAGFLRNQWGIPTSISPNAYPWNRPSDKYLELFPIPATALEANPKLKQNPGY